MPSDEYAGEGARATFCFWELALRWATGGTPVPPDEQPLGGMGILPMIVALWLVELGALAARRVGHTSGDKPDCETDEQR